MKNECNSWLQKQLSGGTKISYREIKQKAKELGYLRGSLKEARKELGVKTIHIVNGDIEDWLWYIEE